MRDEDRHRTCGASTRELTERVESGRRRQRQALRVEQATGDRIALPIVRPPPISATRARERSAEYQPAISSAWFGRSPSASTRKDPITSASSARRLLISGRRRSRPGAIPDLEGGDAPDVAHAISIAYREPAILLRMLRTMTSGVATSPRCRIVRGYVTDPVAEPEAEAPVNPPVGFARRRWITIASRHDRGLGIRRSSTGSTVLLTWSRC